ncbi:hypothetical protein Tco_0005739, partial [Tanacetum coccineum]
HPNIATIPLRCPDFWGCYTYVDLMASIEGYYEENVDHRDQTDKLVQANNDIKEREYRMEVRADYGSNTTTPGFNKNAKFELGGDNEVLSDEIVLSDDERQESKSTNHLHDNLDQFFKTYFNAQERNNICAFEIGQECFDKHKPKIYRHNISELNDILVSNDEEKELLNEGVCKSKKFEVIRYSLGTNEEYISVNTCEYKTWKRTDGIVSSVYHEIFRKKDQGWLVKRTK